MPIDLDLALSSTYRPTADSWDADRVLLYHLGLGAGASLEESELAYVNERNLKVLPTFSVIPAFGAALPAIRGPGLDYNVARMLHGEQELQVFAPLPPAAEIVTTPTVESVWDKGKAAVIVVRADTNLADGTPLCTNRFKLFARGEGGFGGDPGPKVVAPVPEGEPTRTFEIPTLPQQAAIYRLSGDRNPLHIDPGFARRGGFDRPILHGLCSWGMVCKGVVDELLDGDVTAVAGWSSRFAGSVYPGETLVVRAWQRQKDVLVEANVKESGVAALSNAVLTLS